MLADMPYYDYDSDKKTTGGGKKNEADGDVIYVNNLADHNAAMKRLND